MLFPAPLVPALAVAGTFFASPALPTDTPVSCATATADHVGSATCTGPAGVQLFATLRVTCNDGSELERSRGDFGTITLSADCADATPTNVRAEARTATVTIPVG